MKTLTNLRLTISATTLLAINLSAQTFSGTNAPGAFQNFAINVGVGATNLAISVPGSPTVFSHLLLKAGAAPNDISYDFIALADGQANFINLEAPEFKVTNFFLRVETPTNSLTHSFTVTVLTNVNDMRAAGHAATKSVISTNQGVLNAGGWNYFRVDIPTNISGWRILLNSTNVNPDLYVQQGQLPTTSTYLKRSVTQTNDVLPFTSSEADPGAYFIGVNQAAGSNAYTLRTELISFTTLTWDPGLTYLGTQVYTNQSTNGGDYYFKITTQNTALGAWRTALNVLAGDANIYLSKGTPPTTATYAYKSDRLGSDGFVVPASAFNAGEDWYYLVHAEPGAQWTLVTGEPFVTDLGTVAADASSGSGDLSIGAEGMRFFKTVVPINTVAWRLWLTNSPTNSILVKQTSVPVPGSSDLTQAGQMLVVPSYLVGGQLYFVGVSGNPGSIINLDSRQQSFTDIPFSVSTNLTVSGFAYATFRLQVPSNQIAWQVSVVVSNGNPNVALRRNFVPNESNNDAYSEVPGTVTDSILLVPPTLSDGTFYITVYSTNSYSCTLQSGTPEITEINFVSATINTDTNRVGWRLFKASDISQQLGALGWDLFVTNFSPGTRIAIRRNAAPGIWNYRAPFSSSAGVYDLLSTADFLQNPGQQADVWYVGVYNPTNALGNFTLISRPLTADPLALDGGSAIRTNVPAGKWQFFHVNVPNTNNLVGWDIRVTNVTAGLPQLVLRREALPVSLIGIGLSGNVISTNWPTGNQWVAGSDWTGRNFSPDGTTNESGRILTVGYGRPLEPGSYYVGVIAPSNSTNSMAYTVSSRAIGPGYSIPVLDINYAGGSVTNVGLAARDIAVYRVTVPSNSPSWKVNLIRTSGEVMLAAAKDAMPNISALLTGSVTNTFTAGKKMQRNGNEHFVQLPPASQSILLPGTYYLLVGSEGAADPTSTIRIGPGSADYVLQSVGPMPEIDLGTLDMTNLVYNGALEGGESAAFHFHNLLDTLGFELSLANRIGNPVMVSRGTIALADPGGSQPGLPGVDQYGNEGGQDDSLIASSDVITVADPFTDETIMVKARSSNGQYPDASYTLNVRKLTADPLEFDGGTTNVVNQTNLYLFFQVDVPANALGWDARLLNVLTGSPKIIISRGNLALNVAPIGWRPGYDTFWPFGANFIAASDWTQRSLSSDGVTNEDGRILAMGMGRPLQPDTYYIGVYNTSWPAPTSYTLYSRGIGNGFIIPVQDLTFGGGSITNSLLAAREAAYYRVTIPTNASSWQAKLTVGAGEAMLVLLTNNVPSVLSGRPGNAGKSMQKTGNEHYLSLPLSPLMSLPAGTNYLAVVSEGAAVTNFSTRIGPGNSSFLLESRGELMPVNMGTAGTTDLVQTATLEGGEVRAYQFTVPPGISSLQVQLNTTSGYPAMVLRSGVAFPYPGAPSTLGAAGSVGLDDYGNEGGYALTPTTGDANTNLLSYANPSNGIYTVMVKARGLNGVYPNASYSLTVRALSVIPVSFDGGSVVITNQTPNTWRYFRVDIPTNILGWDIRLSNVATSALPKLVVRRDILPSSLTTGPWGTPSITTNWPTTNQWGAGLDWTRRSFTADGSILEDGRILAMGMGQPLEPGTYYIGVINSTGPNPMNYTLLSRGIGDGLSLPVTDLAFNGGIATNSSLLPREAAYYRVNIPSNTPSWKIRMEAIAGEAMLLVLKDHIPSIDCGRFSSTISGKFMQKAGNEHYVLLPAVSQTNIPAGTYYLAVVGEGLNPASSIRIGTDNSTYAIASEGSVVVNNLGTVGPIDLVKQDSLEGGESRFYQFAVPPNIPALEMRLEDRVGVPVMVLLTNFALPDPGGVTTGARDSYGNDGGQNVSDYNANILTVANSTGGVFTVAVKARATVLGTYPDSDYTLRVRQLPVPEINFSSELNTNGLSNVASAQLLDNERAFYKVVVPTNLLGQPILGWELDVSQLSGLATIRVRKDVLPSDTFTLGVPFTPNAAAIVSPFLTNGTWYVEVRGSNSTTFTLTSRAVALQRAAWAMPGAGQLPTTPGLTAPNFADSGVDTNGVPLPGDQGIDLPQGQYHFYAAIVPTNNAGLVRVQVDAISGNSDLYMRLNVPPSYSHSTNGGMGTTLDRSLTGSVTEYANWVPLNGKAETNLASGTWYFAVRSVNNANSRYRLRLSTGNIQDLDLYSGVATNQIVAGGDWRYFRLQMPALMPSSWMVSFSQQSGDVVMYVRDTVPPGNGITVGASDYKDWASDVKNVGPYASYDLPGTYTFNVPPIRPGTVYYLGFRAKNDSIFSVTSTTSGVTNQALPVIAFYGGSVTNMIPPNSQVAYNIFTPADGLRWRHTSIHSNSVGVYIENGTYPTKTFFDHFYSVVANSTLDKFLTLYPWLPNQTYYLLATNTTSSNMFFSFTMNGSSTNADDDADGLPDWWEIKYFGSLAQTPAGDFDGDGVSNLNEFLEGTDPADRNSLKPRLFVQGAINGTVNVNPFATNYVQGTMVTLTATATNAGYNFVGWAGAVTSTVNPLTITMISNTTIIARFRVPADDFDQRVSLFGPFPSTSGWKNAGASKEPGEPNHAGNAGGKSLWFTWSAPISGLVNMTTAGTDFRNALAVYTGLAVSSLTAVATNLAAAGTNEADVSFTAIAGTVYQIAVDGYNGATGTVALSLSMPGVVFASNSARQPNGMFSFIINSLAGQVLRVDATTNLNAWVSLATITNVTGTYIFTDTQSPAFLSRFYRVVIPAAVPITIGGAGILPNGQFQFTISSAAGQSFRIEAGTNLLNWITLATLTNTTGSTQFIDPAAAGFPRRFYRAATP